MCKAAQPVLAGDLELKFIPRLCLSTKNKIKETPMACVMAQQAKELATKHDDPSLVPGTHRIERENQLLQAVLCVYTMAHAHPHMHR